MTIAVSLRQWNLSIFRKIKGERGHRMAKWGPNRLFTLTSAADRGWSLFGTVQFWYSQDFSALLGNIFPFYARYPSHSSAGSEIHRRCGR
jgi:hypothetical protein